MPLQPNTQALLDVLRSGKLAACKQISVNTGGRLGGVVPASAVACEEDPNASAHARIATKSAEHLARESAIAWAEGCALLNPPPETIRDLPHQEVEPSQVVFHLTRGVPSAFIVTFGCYNAQKGRWERGSAGEKIKPTELPRLFALLDHFQGPFQAWGHLTTSGRFTPLMAKDAAQAQMLERFVNSPKGILAKKAAPRPNSVLFRCMPAFDLDMSDVYAGV